jgi:hypothetical protein
MSCATTKQCDARPGTAARARGDSPAGTASSGADPHRGKMPLTGQKSLVSTTTAASDGRIL